MIARTIIAAMALVAAFSANTAHAQVNRCHDASGKVIYSDKPCDSGQKGGLIERQRTQQEIYQERVQAYEAEKRKQQRNQVERQREAEAQYGQALQNQYNQAAQQPGNDWASRKARENAATSAGSIANNGGSWDRAAEAERNRVRQEEARKRAEAFARAQAQAQAEEAAKPKPTTITNCSGYNCQDNLGGSYNRATGDKNLMTGPNGQQCRWFEPTKQWQCR